MPGDEMNFFNSICKPEFDEIKRTQDDFKKTQQKNHLEIMNVLKGKDGEQGLCERVRNLEKTHRSMVKVSIFIIGAIALQFIQHVFTILRKIF